MQRHKKYNAQLLVMSKKLRTFALRNNSNLDSIEYQVMKSKTNKKNIMKKGRRGNFPWIAPTPLTLSLIHI